MKAIVLNEEEFREILKEERNQLLKDLVSLLNPVNRNKKLNAKEAAYHLGISLSTLYKRIKELPHQKFGKKLIFSTDELDEVRVLTKRVGS